MRSLIYFYLIGMILIIYSCTDNKSSTVKLATPDNNIGEMILIPAGEFIMGSNRTDTEGLKEKYGFIKSLFLDEHPQHKVGLKDYYLDKYEVTNIQYKEFVLATKRKIPKYWSQNGYNLSDQKLQKFPLPELRKLAVNVYRLDMDTNIMSKEEILSALKKKKISLDKFPVGEVSWQAATAYCQWAHKRLPTEAEWEKAARGDNGREYPWGNEWDTTLANIGNNTQWENGIAPVGSYKNGNSPYQINDMAGNVWEWVADYYLPYANSTHRNKYFGIKHRIIRGGGGGLGHYSMSILYRGANRQHAPPAMTSRDIGFRCAKQS